MKCSCQAGESGPPLLASALRRRRAVAGGLVLTLAAAFAYAHSWLIVAPLAWLGTAHLIAALTGYPGCPELGLIASLARRRWVFVHGVWCNSDRRFYSRVK